jgi:OmpA-OmpF porin, OOP family
MRKISVVLVSAVLGVSYSAAGHAQYYGGIPLNQPRSTMLADANDVLFGTRFFSVASRQANDALAVKFGYRFSSTLVPHLALVGGYTEAKRLREASQLFGGGQTQKSSVYGLDLVGTLPVSQRFAVSGNAGVVQVRANSIFSSNLSSSLLSHNDNRYTAAGRAGVGLHYDFNRSLGFQFGVERYRNLNKSSFGANDADGDSYTFGVRIRF